MNFLVFILDNLHVSTPCDVFIGHKILDISTYVVGPFYLGIKKRVACLYGVIMHDGGMLGGYERSL